MLAWLKRLFFPSSPMSVTQAIKKMLSDHGVETEQSGDWLLTAGGFPKVNASISDVNQRGTDVDVQLDVRIAIDEESVIVESFCDGGKNSDEAINKSLFSFATSSMHVLLSGVWDLPQGEQVDVQSWQSQNSSWHAHVGPIVRKKTAGHLDVMPPEAFEETLKDLVRGVDLKSEMHWLRCFYANLDEDGRRIVEVLFDNDPWDDAERQIEALDWPVRDYYYSARIFILLLPKATGNE